MGWLKAKGKIMAFCLFFGFFFFGRRDWREGYRFSLFGFLWIGVFGLNVAFHLCEL